MLDVGHKGHRLIAFYKEKNIYYICLIQFLVGSLVKIQSEIIASNPGNKILTEYHFIFFRGIPEFGNHFELFSSMVYF